MLREHGGRIFLCVPNDSALAAGEESEGSRGEQDCTNST
jgi:hypothetical protein